MPDFICWMMKIEKIPELLLPVLKQPYMKGLVLLGNLKIPAPKRELFAMYFTG